MKIEINKLNGKILILSIILVGLIPLKIFAQNSRNYTFVNQGNGGPASNLYIEFDQTVNFPPPSAPNNTLAMSDSVFQQGNGDGMSRVKFKVGNRPVIADGGTVTLSFAYTGNRPPRVNRWWWTNNNDHEFDISNIEVGRLGRIKMPRSAGPTFVSLEPSTGDGSIQLNINDDLHTFNMPAGLNSSQMADAFADFISDDNIWAEVGHQEGGTVIIFSRSHREILDDILINVSPDTTMEVGFNYIPETIPTLSEWGVIILILLLLAVGMVFLYKKQTSLALAADVQTTHASNKTKLFDRQLYAKVLGISLVTGLSILGLAYLWAGEMNAADPFGTLVSSAIVAYMIHFWILHKSSV